MPILRSISVHVCSVASAVSDSLQLNIWIVACQAPLSMGFFSQEYWSGLPFPPPGDLPGPRVEAGSPALAGGFFPAEPPGKSITYGFLLCVSLIGY